MASGLATFRTLTPLQRWSTRRFTYLWRVGSIVSCASGDDEHRRSPSSEWGWERRMGDHIMGCRARGGRGAFMVRSWVGRVQNLGCISGFTPSLVAPKLPVHRCTPSGDVRYRLVHHNHIGSGLFRAPAATPLIPKWPPRGGACIPGGNSAVSARYRAANPGTGVFSLRRAIGCINWGRSRPGWRCRPSVGVPGGGECIPGGNRSVSGRIGPGKPHLDGKRLPRWTGSAN